MLSDKDYELLDEVFQKLKQADNTCSDVVLDPEEVRAGTTSRKRTYKIDKF